MSINILDTEKEKLLEMSPVIRPARTPRQKAIAIAALVVGAIVYGALRDEEGMRHVFRERSRLQELIHSVSGLREENQSLRAQIKALREDPRSLERLAREDLGLSKPGEVVFILESEPTQTPR